MSKHVLIPEQLLETQAKNLWVKLDNAKRTQTTNIELQKEVKHKFWENYEVLLKTAKRNALLLKTPVTTNTKPFTRRPSPPLHLTGVFMMTDNKLKSFKKRVFTHRQLPDFSLTAVLIFILISLNSSLSSVLVLSFLITSIIIIILRAAFVSTPLENTVIEIEPDKIIRRGTKLTTSFIALDKVQKIHENKLGLIVRQTGFWNNVNYLFSENNYTSNSRVVYIPNAIESYDEIKVFLEEKLSKNRLLIT